MSKGVVHQLQARQARVGAAGEHHLESQFLLEPRPHLIEAVALELDDLFAGKTADVMMSHLLAELVAAAVVLEDELVNEIRFLQQSDGAVDSRKTDPGVNVPRLSVQALRVEVIFGGSQDVADELALSGGPLSKRWCGR